MGVLPLDLFDQPEPTEEIEVKPQREEEPLEVPKSSNVLPLDLFDKAPDQVFMAEPGLEEKSDEETIPTDPEESFRQKAQGVKEIIANLGIGGLGYIAGGIKGFGVTGIQKLAEATGLLPEHLEMTTEERRKIRAAEIERASTLGGLITPKTEFGKKGMEKIGEWLEPIQKFAESKADIFDKDKSPYLHDLTQFGIELFLFHLGGKAGSKARKVVKLEEKIKSATGKVKKKLQGKLGKETDALIEMANKIAKEKPELLQKVKDYQDKMLERRVKNQQLISGAEGFSAFDIPKKRGLPGAEAFQAELKPLIDARKSIEKQREIQRKLEKGVQPEKAPLESLTYPEKPLQTGRPALTASELSKQIEQRRQKAKISERLIKEEPISDLEPSIESEVISLRKVFPITEESLPIREFQISPETGKPELTFTATERKTYQIGEEGIKLADKVPGEKSVWKIITDPLTNESGAITIPLKKVFKDKKKKPVIGYHGTQVPKFKAFDNSAIQKEEHGWAGAGHYFTTNKEAAQRYSEIGEGKGRIIETVFDIKNPIEKFSSEYKKIVQDTLGQSSITNKEQGVKVTEALKKKGYDAVIVDKLESPLNEINIFDSKNIHIIEKDDRALIKAFKPENLILDELQNKYNLKLRFDKEGYLPARDTVMLKRAAKKEGLSEGVIDSLLEIEKEKSVWSIVTDPLKNEKGFIEIPNLKIFKKKLSPERRELIKKSGRAAEQAGMKLTDFLIQGGMTKDQAKKFEKLYKMAKIEDPLKGKRKVVQEIEDVLSTGLEVVKDSDNFKAYYDYLVKEKRLLSDTKVMDQAPDFVRPMIEKGDYPELITNRDLGLWQVGESPHGKFDWFYDLKDNPAYDAWESSMTSRMNIDYQKAWSDKLVKEIWSKKAQKDLNKTLKPYQERLFEDIKSVGVLEKKIRKNKSKIKEMSIGDNRENLIEHTEKMQRRLEGRIEKINTVMEEAITNHADKLAKKHSSIRVMLASEGRLSEKIKLTEREKVIVKEIKKYFEKAKHEMIRNDIPVREGDYTPNLFKAALGTEEGINFFSKKKSVPSVLRFQHRGKSTRSWYPDMKTMFDSYIPAINRKVAYQPFLDRWREASAEMPPELSKYFENWINKELHYEQPGKLGKLTNFAVAIEYFRTIGFALRVAVKHTMKAPHTISEIGLRQTIKGIYRGPERLVESAFLKLNLKEQASSKARLLSSFYNTKQIVQLLEGSGFENAQSIFKTLPGSATTMIEFIENGINVLAMIDSGMSKSIDPKIIQKRIWESLLDANHRPGLDDFPWRRNNPAWRSMTLFLNTPAKLLEHQKKLLRKTLTGKKDAYGTPYGKKLVYILASIGLAETVARSHDTSILEMMLHIPMPHTMLETVKGIVHGIEYPETIEFRKMLPQIARIYKTTQDDYNKNYYSSPTRSLFGFSKLKKKNKNKNKHKGIGTIGGIGSIGGL